MPKMKYIYYNRKYICSTDNFKHWTTESALPPDCVIENKRDIITKVKLYEEYGAAQGDHILKQLQEIREDLKIRSPERCAQYDNDGYGYAFEVFAIAILHKMTYRQAMDCVVHGTNDGKVDAVVPTDGPFFYAYQIKLFDSCDPSDFNKARAHIDEFLRTGTIADPNCDDLVAHLKTNAALIRDKRLKIKSVCANKKSDENCPSHDVFKQYFENILLPREHSNLELRFPIEKHTVTLPDGSTEEICNYACQADSSSNSMSILVFTRAEKIVDDLIEQGITSEDDRLYQDNVRGKLGINEPMRKTIEGEPEKYVLYNNGLSVIGDYKLSQTEFIVSDPSFINGQQTLYNLIAAKTDGKDISKITIPVFIKTANTPKDRQNIAFYNNAQRPIKDIDLLSLNGDLRAIQKDLFEKALKKHFDDDSYFLKLISSGKRDGDAVIGKLFKKHNIISLSEFVRLYWIIDKKSNLGDWKNSIGKMIRSEIIEKTYRFDTAKSERICKLIAQFYNFISSQSKVKQDEYKNADVAFMYLINSFNGDISKAQAVIDRVHEKFFLPKQKISPSAKLIDLYKSNAILEQIKEVKAELNM